MSSTTQFELPLIAEGQAQKHITVNEALARLDAMAQLRLHSLTVKTPPSDASDGQSYGVPEGANGHWAGFEGQIAIYANQGWVFVAPKIGWRAWVVDTSIEHRFDGAQWVRMDQNAGLQILHINHTISRGESNLTAIEIPANSWVLSITYRVQEVLRTTDNTGWQLGHSGDMLYWGNGKSGAKGTAGIGYNSGGMIYFQDSTPLLLSVPSGAFRSGQIDFQVYYFPLQYPT